MDTDSCCWHSAVGIWVSELLLLSCDSAHTLEYQNNPSVAAFAPYPPDRVGTADKAVPFWEAVPCRDPSGCNESRALLTPVAAHQLPRSQLTGGARTPASWDPNGYWDFSGILCCMCPSSSPVTPSYLLPLYSLNFSWFSCLKQSPTIKKSSSSLCLHRYFSLLLALTHWNNPSLSLLVLL